MKHTCHARGCNAPVDPAMLFCLTHWRMTPKDLQREVYRTYRRGQEIDKNPSAEYLAARDAAIEAVALAEGRDR